jgi:asparagine synthase (glutamine-hydrolysing)
MPGIYGFFATKVNPVATIERMTESMYLYDYFVKDQEFTSNAIAASRVHLGHIGEQTSPTQSGSVAVWVEGEAYNLNELSNEFELPKGVSFERALIETYKKNQLTVFLNKVDGCFCAVLYDQNRQQVKLITDRYGMRMLYCYFQNGQFAWSSEVKGILALNDIDKTIDSNSFDCFMDLGHLLGGHTWFEQIKLVKPATLLTFDIKKKNLSQENYWKWSEIKPSNLTFDEGVDELGHLFIKSVERRFNPDEKNGIALSGGLDSRAIFAAVNHLYPDYRGFAFTFGVGGCDDIQIAKQVVAKTKWRYKEFHFTDQNWFDSRIESVWNTDGMLDMMHMHGGEFVNEISKEINVNLNGYLGDAIFGGSYFKNTPYKNTRINKDLANDYYGHYFDKDWLNSNFFDLNHIDPFLYMSRGRRFVNMGIVNGLIAVDQRAPFFDNDCVELIFSLPDEYRLNNKLYAAMLQKFFPKFFKNIPWQKTGRPANVYRNTIVTRAVNKGFCILKSLLGGKDTKGFTDYANWIRNDEISSKLNELLDPDKAQYFKIRNNDLRDRYLTPHLNNEGVNNSNEILRISTIELYLRKANEL